MKSFLTFLIVLVTFYSNSNEAEIPSITLKSIEGENVNINADVKTRDFTIVYFWASWVTPCKRQLDQLSKVLPNWKEKIDVEIVGVTIDQERSLERLPEFISNRGWNFKVLLDPKQDLLNAMDIDFSYKGDSYSRNNQGVPHVYLVDKNGSLLFSAAYSIEDDIVLMLEDQLTSNSNIQLKEE